MLDALPFHQSMKATHRVRRFRPSNAEHRHLRARHLRHNPTVLTTTREKIAA